MSKLMKTLIRTLRALVIILLCTALTAAVLVGVVRLGFRRSSGRFPVSGTPKDEPGADRIHFLSTGSSDCILIESNGFFALVDSGEDSDYPADKPSLRLTGYEEEVYDYLSRYAARPDGTIALEFIVGTHSHSDHIGGFDELISAPDVTVGRAYLKKYDETKIIDMERRRWDNTEVYTQMLEALNERGIPVISDISEQDFTLGDFTLRFFNTVDPESDSKVGENDNSLGLRVSKAGRSVFLAGDIDNKTGDEDRLAGLIGKVDVLKPGHHGYISSSSRGFIDALDPDIVIITNRFSKAVKLGMPCMLRYLYRAGAAVYTSADNGGVVLGIEDDGGMKLFSSGI